MVKRQPWNYDGILKCLAARVGGCGPTNLCSHTTHTSHCSSCIYICKLGHTLLIGRPSREAVGLNGQTLLRVQRNGLDIVSKT
jgi:hypothetical protein